ncbi:uncharacterized protein LOC120720526 isoform X3 [Simochromis diagramma]|uniref:uncharacterized protein LOC120720526 isoform X3 n=1 Tax=Simochromis diagramma TaxID=43689 RepID=UPI001A7EAFB5|nr:uncharacterized protein LOC120720526 isoform X3 [Simochromis diagramma]
MPATHRAFALISLLSFSAAAPTVDDCNQLTQPLQANELHQILGRWIFIQGLAGNGSLGDTLRFVESTWMVLNTTSDSQTLQAEIAGRVVQQLDQSVQPQEDRCLRNVQNMSLVDGKDLEFYMKIASSYHRFLQTCSDCLLMHTYDKVANHQLFYLFARNKTVTASDLETFRKQGECLRFPTTPKFNYNPNNGHEQLSKHFTTYRTVYDCVRDK